MPARTRKRITLSLHRKWLKRGGHESNKYKEFIVHLLSPHLVFQDSCRMLVALALHLGVFQHFQTWEQLQKCQPGQHGSPILVKSSFLDLPIFTKEAKETMPFTYNSLHRITTFLPRLAKFPNRFNLTQIRRGDAYLLDVQCKHRSVARTLMGQQTEGRAFNTYLSITSTIDVQSHLRLLGEKDFTRFSSLRLGSYDDDVPHHLDRESILEVQQDPLYQQAVQMSDQAKQSCLEEFGSLPNARRASATSSLHREYLQAKWARSNLFRRLCELKFRAYREQQIVQTTAAKPLQPEARSEVHTKLLQPQ